MSDAGEERFTCRHCGHEVAGEAPDHHGWCAACKRALVRRSGVLAIFPALLVVAGYLYLLDYFGLYQSTFMIIFLAIGAGIAWVAFKVARRVLYDVLRVRGTRPPTRA